MISQPTSGNNANISQMIPRLCCALGQAPVVQNYNLSLVKAVVLAGQNTPFDQTAMDGANSRTATPDANRNWKFCVANGNELPVPSTSAHDGDWNTLWLQYSYTNTAMPPETIKSTESVSWTVQNVMQCGSCP